MGKISRDCDKDVTSGKSWELMPLSERICGLKLVQIDLSEKRITLDYQLTVLLVKVVRTTLLKIPSQYETYTWRPLACYPFTNIGSIPFVALCSLFVPKIIKFRLCINLLQAKM